MTVTQQFNSLWKIGCKQAILQIVRSKGKPLVRHQLLGLIQVSMRKGRVAHAFTLAEMAGIALAEAELDQLARHCLRFGWIPDAVYVARRGNLSRHTRERLLLALVRHKHAASEREARSLLRPRQSCCSHSSSCLVPELFCASAPVMKSYFSNVGNEMINDLRVLSGYHFQERCAAILQTVFPGLRSAPALGPMDCAGIDHCVFGEDPDGLQSIYQCKGFEVPEMQASQLAQCLKSVDSFAHSSMKAKAYYLVVNRIVKGETRKVLEQSLSELVRSGKAETAELQDLEAFLERIFLEAQRQVMLFLRESNRRYREQYQLRMEDDIYVDEVPYRLGDNAAILNNPLRFAKELILKLAAERTNKRSWLFVVGEFGFGKTALALRITAALQGRSMTCVYLPIAQFQPRAIEGDFEFLWAVLELINPEQTDRSRDRDRVLHSALKEILKREKGITLILDGIDEHPICWREGGLKNIFGVLRVFNCTCLFTVREEFVAERSGYFTAAIMQSPHACFIYLREWNEPLVLRYTDLWRQRCRPVGADVRIGHFVEAVKSGAYTDFYGDIPKRPLFLKMLLEDVATSDIRSRNLAEIYSGYLINKFAADRSSSTQNPVVRRPLSLDEDYAVVCARLFDVMARAAGKMYEVEEYELRLLPVCSEEELRACAHDVTAGGLDIPTILSNSVLVPTGPRRAGHRGGMLTFAFAHKSFQDFFLAKYVLAVLSGRLSDDAILKTRLPPAVHRFLRGLFDLQDPAEQAACRERLSQEGGDSSIILESGSSLVS